MVPVVRDRAGAYLLCRMPPDRGVYPGQWGLPGGGVEEGERIEEALRREAREELGLELADVRPLFFKDLVGEKLHPDGRRESLYLLFLLYECRAVAEAAAPEVRLNDELDAWAWVDRGDLARYDLNSATVDTFRWLGLLPAP